MNQLHHASTDKAFLRLAVSAKQMTVESTIGGRTAMWALSSVSAAKVALEPLQRQMLTRVERIDATRRECDAVDGQSNVISSVEAFEVV